MHHLFSPLVLCYVPKAMGRWVVVGEKRAEGRVVCVALLCDALVENINFI